jgi:excisionase family DNA binding protein
MSVFIPPQHFLGELSLTTVEAARLLRLSRRTIYKLCAAGVLKGAWVGNCLRISTRSVLDYMLPTEQVEATPETDG